MALDLIQIWIECTPGWLEGSARFSQAAMLKRYRVGSSRFARPNPTKMLRTQLNNKIDPWRAATGGDGSHR